jgi:hypothetical protein
MLQIRNNLAMTKLAENVHQVRDLHARIDHQRQVIEELAGEGHDTTTARNILDSLLISLFLYVEDRHRLSVMLNGQSIK